MPLRSLPPQAKTIVSQLARQIARSTGAIGPYEELYVLDAAEQDHYMSSALFVVDPEACGPEVLVQLCRSLTYKIHNCAFDKLTIDERHDIAEWALTAWETMRDMLKGKVAHIPLWERQCLTFSGPYDPELLTLANTGTVQ
jgi:hypothetical protein